MEKIEDVVKFQETISKDIMFILTRSKNANVVVYEGMVQEDRKSLVSSNPVDAYWLDIDPAYVEANRKKGKMDDRVDLNMIERKMAYGLSAAPIADQPGAYQVTLVAFTTRTLKVYLNDKGECVAEMLINGKKANLKKIDIESQERTLRPALVVHVDLYGIDLETGEMITERITP